MTYRLIYFLTDFKFYLLLLAAITIFGILIFNFFRHKVVLVILSTNYYLLAIFILGEAYFRYIYDQSDGLGFLRVNQKWHQRHVVFNNYFKRDRDFSVTKQADEFRIAVIGDSVAFGGGIEEVKDRFSNLLEAKLRADSLNVQVYNLGVSGTGTSEQIEQFSKLKHLNFDLIVWQYFFNDIQPRGGGKGTEIIMANKDKFSPPSLISWLTNHSYFADWLYWRLSAKYNQTFRDLLQADVQAYQNRSVLIIHQQEITAFVKSLQSIKLPVVVIIFPFLLSDVSAPSIYQQMTDFFRSEKVTSVIDLTPTFAIYPPSQLVASRFDSHPNELAHQLTADQLYQVIKSLLP